MFISLHEDDDKLAKFSTYVQNTNINKFSLDLSIESVEEKDTWWEDLVEKSHTLFLFILWGPMTDIGVIIIRYVYYN